MKIRQYIIRAVDLQGGHAHALYLNDVKVGASHECYAAARDAMFARVEKDLGAANLLGCVVQESYETVNGYRLIFSF